jgi:hypothetical protein
VIPAELYGPFGALAVLGFVVVAVIRGDLVPGFIYKAAVARAEKSDIQAERTATALDSQAAQTAEMSKLLAALAKAAADAAPVHGAPKDG